MKERFNWVFHFLIVMLMGVLVTIVCGFLALWYQPSVYGALFGIVAMALGVMGSRVAECRLIRRFEDV